MAKLARPLLSAKHAASNVGTEFGLFVVFLYAYLKKNIFTFFLSFEAKKNILVKFFLMKRGRYNRPFLHFATIGVLGLGVLIAPVLSDTYPIFSTKAAVERLPSPSTQERSVTVDQNVFHTDISQKPRDTIITYTVERGDTISTIADKFGISTNTIKWENSLSSDDLSVGDQLRILPVTGVSYKVSSGDSIYSIAKKLNTDPQKIADFPFNNFSNPETFSLVEGQILIVPDGIKPSEQPYVKPQPNYIAQSPAQVDFSGGGFHWPLQGEITQGFSWYHTGVDIAGPVGTPIYAAKSGTVAEASCGWNWGYGCHVLISHGGGWATMYAHMVSTPVVSVGEAVNAGQLIGNRGNTGRSTGPHTHFEIRSPGGNVNPLSYLQ